MNEFKNGQKVWAWDEDEITDKVDGIYVGPVPSGVEESDFKHVVMFETGEVYTFMFVSSIDNSPS